MCNLPAAVGPTPTGSKLKQLLLSRPDTFKLREVDATTIVQLLPGKKGKAVDQPIASSASSSRNLVANPKSNPPPSNSRDPARRNVATETPMEAEHSLSERLAWVDDLPRATATAASWNEAAGPVECEALRTLFQPEKPCAYEPPRTTLYRKTLHAAGEALLQPSEPPGASPTPQVAETERALLGHVVDADATTGPTTSASAEEVYVNLSDPFCLVTVGVQGAGKSHSVGCMLEACLLRLPPISYVRQPMAALVCHFDQSDASCCEAIGLGRPSRQLSDHFGSLPAPHLSRDKMLVLCSPTFYQQRKRYYGELCEVRPLLLRWGRLKAKQIKTLMRLDEASQQLYAAVMLDELRRYQREELLPAYEDFIASFKRTVSSTQSGPLQQRFQLLSSFIHEAECNVELRSVGADLADVMGAGKMVVVDLTDQMMSPADANGVFHVLLDTFRGKHMEGAGKLVLFDEAHRYMGLDGAQSDQLANAITDCARVMRHEGLRLLISTQSPKALPEELLELTSVLIAHRYQSRDWHEYLARKLPLPKDSFEDIRGLASGEALVYSAKPGGNSSKPSPDVIRVQVRKRMTTDLGASLSNRDASPQDPTTDDDGNKIQSESPRTANEGATTVVSGAG